MALIQDDHEPDDGFILVKNKRKSGKSKRILDGTLLKSLSLDDGHVDEVSLNEISKRVLEATRRMESESSQFLCHCRESLENALSSASHDAPKDSYRVDVYCYGLGNYSTCPVSRFQLSLLLSLIEHPSFRSRVGSVKFFDPVFTSNEKKYLASRRNTTVLSTNNQCCQNVGAPSSDQPNRFTLFYMPHCDASLFNNLLWANWSVEELRNIIIFGNSFKYIVNHQCVSERIARKRYKYLFEISKNSNFHENVIRNNLFIRNDCFNDLSIHYLVIQEHDSHTFNLLRDVNCPTYDHANEVL